MFGLEPEKAKETDVEGQGGEEVSYAAGVLDGCRTGESLTDVGTGENPGNPGARMAAEIKGRLVWLERHTARQLHKLARLEKAAGERVGEWAATPSIWPVKGPVSSRFGPRISPFTGKRAFHAGLDISGPRGKTVRAPAKGKVVEAAYDWKIGNFIRINHRLWRRNHLRPSLQTTRARRPGSKTRRRPGPHRQHRPLLNRPAPPLPDSRKRQSRRSPPIYTRLASPPFPAVNPAFPAVNPAFSCCYSRFFLLPSSPSPPLSSSTLVIEDPGFFL